MKKITLIIVSIFLIKNIVFSAILLVPTQYGNIQLAIDNASNGDTILVEDGTYSGIGNYDITFNSKQILLKSISGANNTIIDCQNVGRGFIFNSGELQTTIIDGFTIKNGNTSDYGGGVSCFWGSPLIKNCIIQNNHSERGGGISLRNSDAKIENCIINNNTSTWGGGVYLYESNIIIDSTDISYNTCGYGSIQVSTNSELLIKNSTVNNNNNSQDGTIGIYYVCTVFIENCYIMNNEDDGVNITNGSSVNITNSIIAKNGDCGIWASSADQINIINSDIIYNEYNGIYSQSSTFNIMNSILYGNLNKQIYLYSQPLPSIEYSNIQERTSGGIVGTINWGNGNIDVVPCFVDINEENYHLEDTSLCNGAGTLVGAPINDLDDNPRPLPLLSNPDIGAYETEQVILTVSDYENHIDLNIYPNPTNGIITIESINIEQVHIIDITGRIVKRLNVNNSQVTIDLREQVNGVYFVKVITKEGQRIDKLVIK